MEFKVGKLYVSDVNKFKGCVFEYVGYDERSCWYMFKAIKGNDVWLEREYPYTFTDETLTFKPLIPTEDDVHEYEPCEENGYDEINRALHYNQGIEVIDFVESHNMNFNEGNVIKYVTRAKYKGTYLKDLKKARYYLDRLISKGENHD